MSTKKKINLFNVLLYIFTFIILVKGVFVGTVMVIEDFFNEGKVRVPDFFGMPLAQAKKIAPKYKLKIQVTSEQFDEHMGKNIIIKQDPQANFTVKKGRTVELIISKGKKQNIVPNVASLSIRQAEELILRNGFSLGKKTFTYSDQSKDIIVSQSPEPGINVKEGEFINLLISKGPKDQYVILPDFVGGNYVKVKDIILMLGLNIGKIKYDYIDNKEAGEILSQDPESGIRIKKGEGISLVVNKKNTRSSIQPKSNRKTIDFEYNIPDGILDKELKLILIDDIGIREIHRKKYPSGSTAKFKIYGVGKMKTLIYIDNLKIDEREY